MTVFVMLSTKPQGAYDTGTGSKITYLDSQKNMIFFAIDEKEYPDVLDPWKRDGVVSRIYRESLTEKGVHGARVQKTNQTRLAALITRQGQWNDEEE